MSWKLLLKFKLYSPSDPPAFPPEASYSSIASAARAARDDDRYRSPLTVHAVVALNELNWIIVVLSIVSNAHNACRACKWPHEEGGRSLAQISTRMTSSPIFSVTLCLGRC